MAITLQQIVAFYNSLPMGAVITIVKDADRPRVAVQDPQPDAVFGEAEDIGAALESAFSAYASR